MRNAILKGSLLVALGYLPVLGCGGGNDDGGSTGIGGAMGRGGSGGRNNGGTAGVIPTTGGNGAVGNNGSGASAGTLNEDTACVADSRTGSRANVALYFMVDISGSMNCPVPEEDPPCEVDPGNDPMPSRWTEASQAYKDFFSSQAANGLNAGISFFSGNSCDPDNYDADVEIGELPGNTTRLNNAIDAQNPGGNTPTVPSLTAAIDHVRDWATDNDATPVVVYATDGYPRGCSNNNTIDDAVDVAADGLDGSPSVRTYVLAIGPNLGDLNRIAVAGGTGQAIAINTGEDVGAQLIEALNQIRDDVVIDCAYTIPPPPAGQVFVRDLVNVRVTDSQGNERDLYPADSNCNEGWRYDDRNAPTQIILCGSTCDEIQNDPGASVEVLFGCATIGTEPP